MKKQTTPIKPSKPLPIAGELHEASLDKVSGGTADTHLKIDGIDGESTHTDHKGEIEILSWKTK